MVENTFAAMPNGHDDSAALVASHASESPSAASDRDAFKDPSVAPVSGACMWNDLPPELKITVFEFAYGPYDIFKPITRADWDRKEKQWRAHDRANFKPIQFPGSHVDRFMVDRAWLSWSTQLFFKRSTFKLSELWEVRNFCRKAWAYSVETNGEQPHGRPTSWPLKVRLVKLKSVELITSVVVTSFHESDWDPSLMSAFTALKKIHLALMSASFDDCDKSIKDDEWSQTDFFSDGLTGPVLQACHLVRVSVEPVFYAWDTASQRKLMETNLRTFNAMLQSPPRSPRKLVSNKKQADAHTSECRSVIGSPSSQMVDLFLHSTKGLSQSGCVITIGLQDLDIPSTEEDFAKLVFDHGLKPMFRWVQGALMRLQNKE